MNAPSTTILVGVWCRKTSLEKASGVGHMTNGSVVKVAARTGLGRSVPVGTVGKVVETGTANKWASKKAVGTTQALKVQFEFPVSTMADGVYWVPKGDPDQVTGNYQVIINGQWLVGDPNNGDIWPALFTTREDALAGLRFRGLMLGSGNPTVLRNGLTVRG